MSSIDSRIVTMKFDNTAFQRGVTTTLDALGRLSSAVSNMSSSKSLGAIDTSKATAGLAQVGAATDTVASKFSAMSVVAITALATIAHKAVESALSFTKAFTFGPIFDGLAEYQLNLQSIQTIQANTDQPLTKINASLEELNRYSDQTIYNFAEMAKNIGTFTAAGVDLKTATSSIKGIANMAALSGSTSQQASTAMYQLSQAISSGRVSLMDWNSVVNAGMGGEKLQNALAQTAVAMGTLNENAIGTTGAMKTLAINGTSFRNSISAAAGGDETWLTSDVLVNTLASLDGRFSMMALTTEKTETGLLRYTEAQAKASVEAARLALEQKNGVKYTDEQFKALMKLSDSSFLAATQVKTLGQVFDVAKETLASGWAATFKNIFGDFAEAKKTFTELSGFINDGINAMALARNKVLAKWNDLGGRDSLIQGLKNAFEALYRIVRPIGRAFRDIFPPQTAKDLLGMTQAFEKFTESLIINGPMMRNIRHIFGALFGVLGVGWEIAKGVFRYFFSLFDLFSGGAKGVLDLSGSFAEVVKNLTEWILKGDYIAKFFDNIIAGRAAMLKPIIDFLGDILSVMGKIVRSGVDITFNALSDAVAYLSPILNDLGSYLQDKVVAAFEYLKPIVQDLGSYLSDLGGTIQTKVIAAFEKLEPILTKIKDAIKDAFGSLSGIGGSAAGALGGLGSMFDIGDSTDAAASGIDKVKDALSSSGPVADKARAAYEGFVSFLKGLGGFLVDLGGSISSVLGQIWDDVVETFTSLGGGAAGAAGGIKTFFSGIGSLISEFFGEMFGDISFGEVIVAINSLLFTGIAASFMRFLYQFGGIFKDMRGMFQSVGGIFDQVTNNLKTMQTDVRANIILKIAIALGILAAALYVISTIDGPALARSLSAVAAMLLMLVTSIKALEANMPAESDWKEALRLGAVAVVLLALAGSLLLLAIAMKILATMSWGDITKGLVTVGALLATLVVATKVLNKAGGAKSILIAAFAMGVLALSLMAMAAAIKLYSEIDINTLFEGGGKVALIIAAIGLAMRAFPAAGAMVAAASMLVMSAALVIIAKALGMIAEMNWKDSAQALITLGAALLLMVVAANAMEVAMPGAQAMVVMAVSLVILAKALQMLAELDWKDSIQALLLLAGAFTVIGLATLILTPIIPLIAALGVAIAILGVGLALIGGSMLMFAVGFTMMAVAGAAGMTIVIGMINQFLEAMPGFVQRFGETIHAVADVIRKTAPDMANAIGVSMRAFLDEVIKTVPKVGKAIRVIIAEILKTLRQAVPDMIRTGFIIINAFLSGLSRNISKITAKGVEIALKFIRGVESKMDKIVDAGYDLVIKFVKAVSKKIIEEAGNLAEDAYDMGVDMVNGLTRGLINYGLDRVASAVRSLAGAIPGPIKKLLGIFSPSRVLRDIGVHVSDGLALGIGDGEGKVGASGESVAKMAVLSMKSALKAAEDLTMSGVDPTITPVLDLSRLTQEANKIGGLLSSKPLVAELGYNQATAISSEVQSAQEAANSEEASGVTLNYEQYNYSPKAISPVDTYRQTKNQLALAERALKT